MIDNNSLIFYPRDTNFWRMVFDFNTADYKTFENFNSFIEFLKNVNLFKEGDLSKDYMKIGIDGPETHHVFGNNVYHFTYIGGLFGWIQTESEEITKYDGMHVSSFF